MNRTLLLLAFAAPLFGCDLINSVQSSIVVGGIVAASPEIKFMNQINIPKQTVATVYVGQRDSLTSSDAPKPIKGASVTVQFSGNEVVLPEMPQAGQDGFYVQTSAMNMGLAYAGMQEYTFKALVPGDVSNHGGSVTAPTQLSSASITTSPEDPPVPMIQDVKQHAKNADLTVSWQPQNGHYAYVTVFRADKAHPDMPQQVFDSSPKTAGDIIKFVLGTPPTSITIPGATFSQDGLYGVLLVTMDNGMANANTFLGSPMLAGSGAPLFYAVGNLSL